MPELFGTDIAGIIADAMKGNLLPATLTIITPGTRSASDLSAGTQPGQTDHTGSGFVDQFNATEIDGTLVKSNDVKILLIANSFPQRPAPSKSDKITIESNTYVVISAKRDPAAATYTCHCRG